MNIRTQGANTTFHNLWALINVLLNPVEFIHIFRAAQELHKIFIMCNDQKLEVALLWATLDYPETVYLEHFITGEHK